MELSPSQRYSNGRRAAHVPEVQRVPELVEKGRPVGGAAARAKHDVDFVGRAHRGAERARAFAGPILGVVEHPATGDRVDAHLPHLTPDLPLHRAGRELLVELASAKERCGIGARRVPRLDVQRLADEAGIRVLPQGVGLVEKRLALRPELAKRDSAERLERRVVSVGEVECFDDLSFALEPLAPHRRQLRADDGIERALDEEPLAAIGRIGDGDGGLLILELSRIVEAHHGPAFPGDLALLERSELARALELGEPFEKNPRLTVLFGPRGGIGQLRADEGQRLRPNCRSVALVHPLQLGRRLESRAGEIVLARDLFHECLPVFAQTFNREPLHPATRPAMMSRTRSDATRSWSRVSRSRIVTVLSAIV